MSWQIELPFPPQELSGHHNVHWRLLQPVKAKHRKWAECAAKSVRPEIAGEGDILVRIDFFPPNRRGDRVNFPNRMKPYFDGIADALKVNDSRFLPSYYFHLPQPPHGRVIVTISEAP